MDDERAPHGFTLLEVIVAVALEREDRRLDPAQLQWGIEKTIDTHVETAGTAKQVFVLETTREGR